MKEAKFPALVNDSKAVIRFVTANASQFQFDTTFICITGSSSGGNLAAIAGTSRFVKQYTLGKTTVDLEGNVDPNDPPFLIFHDDKDRVVPHCQSELLYAALQKAKVPGQFYLVPNGQHGPGVQIDQNLQVMVNFSTKSQARNKL
jgi:acetyl esterase/lipase